MMDRGEIEFSKNIMEESVNVITDARFVSESSSRGPRPLTIFFENDPVLVANMMTYPLKLTMVCGGAIFVPIHG